MPQNKPTLLHLITALHTGGAERMLAALTHEQVQRYRVHVAYLKPIETLRPLFHPEVEFHYVPMGAGAVAGLQKLVRDIQPAVVHTHLGHADLLGMLALGSLPVQLVCTMHNMGFSHGWKTKMYAQLYRVSLATTGRKAQVVAISHSVAEHVRLALGVPAGRITTLYNPLSPITETVPGKADAQAALGIGLDSEVILYMGRLEREKGPDVLLNALGRMKKEVPNLLCLVLGEGNMLPGLQEQAKALGLEDVVRFEGYQNRTLPYLAAADVLCAPSRSEALSNTVLEAFRLGLPVAASRTGGLAELLDQDRFGLLSDPGDAKALAANLLRLLNEQDLRTQYAAAGRERVALWPTMASYSQALDKVYGLGGNHEATTE